MADTNDDLPLDREVMMALDDAFTTDLDPIPPQLTQFAIDALQWRLIDEELAVTTFDSASQELVGVRGTDTMRHTMRFDGHGISVAVSVLEASLVVSIEPAGTYACRVDSPHDLREVSTDQHGQLALGDSRLPLRVIVETASGRVVSPWITG